MNRERKLQFTYGSIVQLTDLNQEYKDLYFFIDFVSPTKIKLLSNEGLQQHVLEFDDDGKLLNDDIEEIQVVFQPKEGYAALHHYVPGTKLSIAFVDGQKLKGKVVDLQEDMITIQNDTNEMFFIDFHYSGIDEEYNIENIHIEEISSLDSNTSIKIENFEEEDEEFLDIYTMEQQVDDYINKQYKEEKKRSIQKDIMYYKQLISKYTHLEEGIPLKRLSDNLFLESFYHLNDSFLHPVSSYINRHVYDNTESSLNNEIQDDDTVHTVLLHDESSYHTYPDSAVPNYQKRHPYHKKVAIKKGTPVVCINHQQEEFQYIETPYVGLPKKTKRGEESTIQTRTTPYMCEYLEKGQTFILNGTMVHNTEEINTNQTLQQGQTLLTKSIKNIHPHYPSFKNQSIEVVVQESKNATHSPASFFNKNAKVFYPLTEYHVSFKHYIQSMNIRFKDACAFLNITQGLSLYELLRQMTFMRVHDIRAQDYQWMQKEMKKTIDTYKSSVVNQQKKSAAIQPAPYQFVSKEELHTLICNHYRDYVFATAFPSEILHQTMVDDGLLFLYYLKIKNKDLSIDFDDSEIQAHIQMFNQQLQENQNNNLQQFQKKPVKTYQSLQQMEKDTNRLVLKDADDSKGQTNTQYLYHYLVSQFGYTDDLELFSEKLNELLVHYDSGSSIEQNDDLREKLFGHLQDKSATIFTNLLSKIIELQVRNGDKCVVLENKETFVYNGDSWIPLEKQKVINQKRKMLRVQNSTNEFESLKDTIINDYILQMIDSIQNEKSIEMEKRVLVEPTELIKRKMLKSNVFMRTLLKYNVQKLQWIGKYAHIQEERKQLGIVLSPYLPLLHNIMAYFDLSKKYELIQKFISLFCIDKNDPHWYHCILSNTKLAPKYLMKLSRSYFALDTLTHEETLKQICLTEGTISEQGDLWVHKESGYTIQEIAFDTNYGYDENGFKMKMDAIPEQEDEFEEEEVDERDDIVQLSKEEQFQIKKEIRLTQVENQLGHLASTFMNTIGISIPLDKKNKIIREMFNILRLGMAKHKKGDYEKMKVFSILGVLLVYVQTNDIYIKKSFPGCHVSFEGYPLEQNIESDDGILYFSCIVEKISKNVHHMPYKAFHKMTYTEIGEQFKVVLRTYVLQNAYILSMIQEKRSIMHRVNEPTRHIIIEPFRHFRPSLYPLKIKDHSHFDKDPFVSKKMENTYEHMMYTAQVVSFMNKKIEEFLQKMVSNEKPIMMNAQYREPFLQNYCCNQSDFILNHLTKSRANKDHFEQLLSASKLGEQITKTIHTRYVKSQHLNLLKADYLLREEDVKKIYDDLTMYQFIIHHAHFDDDKPISPFLREVVREKPSSFYNRKDDLETKMRKLKENGFLYNVEMFSQLIQDKSIVDLKWNKQQHQEELSNDEEASQERTEFQTDFLNHPFDQSREQIAAMENDISALRDQYKKYVISHMSSFSSELKRIEELLYTFDRSDNKHGINLFLREMIHILTSTVPQIITIQKIQHQKVISKQWNFAHAHNDAIQAAYEKSYQSFEAIESTELISHHFSQINSLREILDVDAFKSNVVSEHIYLKFIFYKILCLYTHEDSTTMTPVEIETIRSINKATIHHLFKMKAFYVLDYSKIKKYSYQTKQGEKMNKTEKLRNMSKQRRRVEKEKMNLKLGEWSYGTNKRVFKYYKDLYEDEDSRANEVKDMMRKMYEQENEDPQMAFQENVDIGDDYQPEQQEGPLGVMEDDELIDAYGNEVDMSEMY